jgi:hypothetical protein
MFGAIGLYSASSAVFRNHEIFFVDTEFSWCSLHSALEELKLAHSWVVHPGKESYSLAKNVHVIPLTELAQIEG